MTQLLYHGTTARVLDKIKRDGILPRSMSKGKSNWKHTIESNRKAVYLTDAYAWHFAAHASDKDHPGLILEIDRNKLLPWLLCPDEDWMEQVTRRTDPKEHGPNYAPLDWGMIKRTRHYRDLAEHNPTLADASLEGMGTCGYYGGIPVRAITRYVIIDWKKLDPHMRIQAVDSMVSALNYKILQDRHRAFTKWFFGDPVEPAAVSGDLHWIESDDPNFLESDLAKAMESRVRAYAKIMEKRDGLTVVDLRKEKDAA